MQPVTPDDYRAIELSCWQGMVDFAQLREDGVEAVVLHATAGTQWVDPYLRQDAKHAGEQGLLLGFIHTLLARDEQTAQQEAAWFFRALSGLVPDFRLCVAPHNENGLSREAFCAVCAAFLQALEALCGHVPMLRVPQSTVKLLTGDLLPYPLWVCAYGVDVPPDCDAFCTWSGFTYTALGRMEGVCGHVPMCYLTEGARVPEPECIPSAHAPITSVYHSRPCFYIIQNGDMLSDIASLFGMDLQSIVELNGIPDPNRIYVGQVLRATLPMHTRGGAFESQYVVQKGDMPDVIARRFGLRLQELLNANEIQNPHWLFPGQVLKLPGRTGRLSVQTGALEELDRCYIAQKGDSLADVARAFDVTTQQLLSLNRVFNANALIPGQVLRLYASAQGARPLGAYIARRRDTLKKIAKRFHTTPQAILADNDIAPDEKVYAGMVLRV